MSDLKKIPISIYPNEMTDLFDAVWVGESLMGYLPVGTEGNWEPKKCDCGCWITYGKECPIEFHSWWCSLVRTD